MADWTVTPTFDFAHGENARSSSLYRESVVEATTRPNKRGQSSRKLVALFEARNPNGLVSRFYHNFPNDVPEGLNDAVEFLERYGGINCLAQWPSRDELYDALKKIELVVGGTQANRNPDWTRDEIILAMDFYLLYRDDKIPGKNSSEIKALSREIISVASALGLSGNEKFRNINGVYMKIMNLRSNDPKYTSEGKVGLAATNKLEREVWERFKGDIPALRSVAASIRSQIDKLDGLTNNFEMDEPEIEEASEGRIVTRVHRTRERSRKIVAEKKRQSLNKSGQLVCEGCNFDFATAYGSRGNGFIECHHTKPVHEMLAGDKTALKDLALVCANCHRMIHAKRPWLTMDELRACVRRNLAKTNK
ncbi:HNH endonuclease [Shimia thalassica]|uniref:HNH endonuclease n=1 Tax=Shimia thalassica TaxID=1715693 RepID=UPI0026E26B8C|nr:HNH endonuclease [Shimia thalassica]MDO6485318.1 HNH endonuclease [Shimia thalassica]MDO6522915.1 HNH endonuclease [Shimia thalassica]